MLTCRFLFYSSSGRYNPITGVPVPVQPTRPNTSAIFGGSPGAIEYMFIPPTATTRPTIPDTTEKRRSLSRESLRRSFTAVPESQPDYDEYSSISDLSECSSETELRERTRTNSGTLSKTRRPITRSTSSRLPVSAKKPTVMKRANSFTRGTDSCVPRGQANDPRGSTNTQQESTSTSDLSNQSRTSNTAGASKIPRKPVSRGAGTQIPQSSRIPLKRADVNSNVANRERSGKEPTINKRTEPVDSKTSSIPTISSKQTSTEAKEPSEPAISKQSAVSGIPTKGGKKSQQHFGSSRIPTTKQGGSDTRGSETIKTTEQNQNVDKENESAMQAGISTLKREGTGDELRVIKNDVTKSKLPRKSSIPRSTKPSQPKTRNNSNTEVETKIAKSSQITKTKTTLTDNKTNVPCARREPSAGPAEVVSTSYALQQSDSGYGDTDSVSSKEDTPVTETGNEFTLTRENSKSKIPIMSVKNRSAAKSSRDGPMCDERKPKQAKSTVADPNELLHVARDKLQTESENSNEKDIKMTAKTESKIVCSGTDVITQQKSLENNIPAKKVDNIGNNTKTDERKTSSKENLPGGLGAKNGVVMSQIESREKIESKEMRSSVTASSNAVTATVGSDGKTLIQEVNKSLQKPAVEGQEAGSSMKVNHLVTPSVQNVSSDGNEKMLKDSIVRKNVGENKDINVGIKEVDDVSNKKQLDNLNESIEISGSLDKQAEGNAVLQKDIKVNNDVEKQALVGSEKITSKSTENVLETVERKTKQTPQKPPRLSKVLNSNDLENKQVLSSVGAEKENVDNFSNKHTTLNKDVVWNGGVGEKSGSTKQVKTLNGSGGARLPQDVGKAKDVGAGDKVGPSTVHVASLVGGSLEKTGGTSEPGVSQPKEVGQLENEGVAEQEDPPRRSDNCMQCRMEQSIIDGEDPEVEDGPGFRQYPTFISPRKSLVMCKHHAKQKEDTDMPREQPLVAMTSFAVTHDKKLNLETLKHKPEATAKIPNLSPLDSGKKEANTVGSKSPVAERSRTIFPVPSNTERNGFNRSESLKTSTNSVNESRPLENKTLAGPKGGHSPLLALSRDKKFAQNTKPTEDIKTALSLEWDDTGTELSPPNFSDDDEPGGTSGDLEDNRRPIVKLMNTNEALDKLKVIQNLIMKEAESRSRKGSEESTGKSNKTGNELVESAGKYSKNPGNEVGNLGEKNDSTSNQVSPTLANTGRNASSPTIWDRITDRSTISQDQTTELLNETLAKLKASPKLSGNALTRRTLSSRSLPGSRQESKEQLTSDGERPVYVYTSNWMNTSGKNSRGSTLSLCSNNRSLPSSRQNLTAREPGLKRSESAAGRMEKEIGKRPEQKERKEYRLSDFDEINLSDDMSELRSQKATTPHQKSVEEKSPNGQKASKKSKRGKKKSKNTAETMNNTPAYGVSMEELADGNTTCQCGGGKCVIS